MTGYLISLALVILGGLVPSTWFLLLFRPSSRVDLALSWTIFGLVGVIFLLYLRSGLAFIVGPPSVQPPLAGLIIALGLGWVINGILWALLYQYLRRRGS